MTSETPKAYDIIIVGAGAAGCVLAGRLAAAKTPPSVLLLESGPHTLDEPSIYKPAFSVSHIAPGDPYTHFHIGNPSEHLAGRVPIVASGNGVGGGSAINASVYTRASASDYDDWANLYNNPGWSSADLIPLLAKTETYQADPDTTDPSHGHSGPLKVSYGRYDTKIGQEFLDVVSRTGIVGSEKKDAQDLKTGHAYAKWAKWIDGVTGRRSDTGQYFIYNQSSNPHLTVITMAKVSRVLFKDKRAIGVEYSLDGGSPVQVFAKKQIVLSAGPLSTPLILERSGIGSKSVLEKTGVTQLVDLPGVGESYKDHQLCLLGYYADPGIETHDAFYANDPVACKAHEEQWISENGGGPLSSNLTDSASKVRPTPSELESFDDAFKVVWNEYYAKAEDKPVMVLAAINALVLYRGDVPLGKHFSMMSYTLYPMSQGRIHITSSNPSAAPDFDPAFLAHPADMAPHVWAYKKGREIARRLPSYRGEIEIAHPRFKSDSQVACRKYDQAPTVDIENLVYSEEDDKAIVQWVRENVQTTFHSMGTTAMKPREQRGVVDSRLNVYGVEGLKVADLSICPSNVGANTYSTALVIGEKAAMIIAEDLGVLGV